MPWTIEIAQLPLSIPVAPGIASHAFWVLKDNGAIVAEWQGLATATDTGNIKVAGLPFDPSDFIGMYNVTAETLTTPQFDE